MIDLRDRNQAAALKSNMHAVFESPQGKDVMEFLEHSCGWYQSCLVPGQPDLTLINDGKRQVLATIKTIMRLDPDQITNLVKAKEEN